MKEVEKRNTPDVSGGYVDGDVVPVIDPMYPQNPIAPIGPVTPIGPTCPPVIPDELLR